MNIRLSVVVLAFLLLAASAHAATVTLTWQDNSSGLNQETEFVIERHLAQVVPGEVQSKLDPSDTWGEIGRVPADTTTFQDEITQHRCYRVKAVNAAGESGYTNMDCTSVGPPSAPLTLEISDMAFSLRAVWGGQELVLEGR